jgi:hypothetical protein
VFFLTTALIVTVSPPSSPGSGLRPFDVPQSIRAAPPSQNDWRWVFIVILLIAGPLMALDPSLLGASAGVVALVALAILVPAIAGLLSGNLRVLAGAAMISAVLLLAARLASGIEIRWYAMAFIFFVILNAGRLVGERLNKPAADG